MSRFTTEMAKSATTRDVINFAIQFAPRAFIQALHVAARDHLAYATKSTSPTAARIASSCGRRCEQIAKAVAYGSRLDLDDIRIRVEAFNLAAKALDLTRTERNAIVNREAVAHIQGSNSDGC